MRINFLEKHQKNTSTITQKTLNYHDYKQFISIAIAFLLLDTWFPILFYFTEKKDKFSLLWYHTCLYFLMICSKNNKLLHINTPWIKSIVLFVVAHVALIKWYWYKQLYVNIIYARFENFPMSNFCMTSISKVPVFLNFVYSPMGASSTGSTPTTIYILMHNFIISYRAGFDLSLSKRAKKNIFNMIPNTPWYVKYFWCKT